jgi:hypothetical protein
MEPHQPRSRNVAAFAAGESIQRLAALTLREKLIVFFVFTMASVVARQMRTVKIARLLQAANPILATFAIPFRTRLDTGRDDILGHRFSSSYPFARFPSPPVH